MRLNDEQKFIADQLRPNPAVTIDGATVDGHAFNIGRWIVREWAMTVLADVAPITSCVLAMSDRFEPEVIAHLDRGGRGMQLHAWAAQWLLRLESDPDPTVAGIARRERGGLTSAASV